jgi:hypothetical protein
MRNREALRAGGGQAPGALHHIIAIGAPGLLWLHETAISNKILS